jgi:hypothetical protein
MPTLQDWKVQVVHPDGIAFREVCCDTKPRLNITRDLLRRIEDNDSSSDVEDGTNDDDDQGFDLDLNDNPSYGFDGGIYLHGTLNSTASPASQRRAASGTSRLKSQRHRRSQVTQRQLGLQRCP